MSKKNNKEYKNREYLKELQNMYNKIDLNIYESIEEINNLKKIKPLI